MNAKLGLVNDTIEDTLNKIELIPAEDEQSDKLVSLLLKSIGARQLYIDSVINDAIDETFAVCLSEQLTLTQNFINRASKIMSHRQSLLNLKRTHQRQIKVYQNIDVNR
ncbi:flagella biosynthesis chaperone for FliD, FliT [Shewanella sp. S1-49-MNA-CIBAN-0167]|uniref:flagella biosynthesis chaperone for FliD, FliT n=1 Tax=Shewanella sp. S1-49-MNA-CIBAN-0167 TaxID=3140468 RepID=UPI003328B327